MSQPLPQLPAKASRRELRKAMLRMRLEMHRQELRHETLVMLAPLRKVRDVGSHWREQLGGGNLPLWAAGGAVFLAAVGLKKTSWRRWLKIALIAVPLLRRNPPARKASSETARHSPAS